MTLIRIVGKCLSFSGGLYLLFVGLVMSYMAAHPGEAPRIALWIVAGIFVAVATVPFVAAFSMRAAKWVAAIVAVPVSLCFLWLTFAPDSQVHRPSGNLPLAQAAAIAFFVLLVARIWDASRQRRRAA